MRLDPLLLLAVSIMLYVIERWDVEEARRELYPLIDSMRRGEA